MKAPGADYSPISQAISARSSALQAGYAAKDASKWKNRYDIQQRSLDDAKEANVQNTILSVAKAGLSFAQDLVQIRETNSQKDLALTESAVEAQMSTLVQSNPKEVRWEEDEAGLLRPVYSDALMAELTRIHDDGFRDKEYTESVNAMLPQVKAGIWSRVDDVALKTTFADELASRDNLMAATRTTAMEADIAGGLEPVTYTVNGNTYTVGEAYLKTVQAENLSDTDMELALISGQKEYREGTVAKAWQSTLMQTGNYDLAKEKIEEAVRSGKIDEKAAIPMVAELNAAFSNLDYDPQRTKLNYGYNFYTGEGGGSFASLLDELNRKYPDDPAGNLELAQQIVGLGASKLQTSVSVAQQNISMAIEKGDAAAVEEAIKSVPGSSIELRAYADNLRKMSDNSSLLALEKEAEAYAGSHTMQETFDWLAGRKQEIGQEAYAQVLGALQSWEAASRSVSLEKQEEYALQVVNDTKTAKTLRQAALNGSQADIDAYFSFLDGRSAEAYGGKDKVAASAEAAKESFWVEKAGKDAYNTLRTSGYSAAVGRINANTHLTTEQKNEAMATLYQQRSQYVAEIQGRAAAEVSMFMNGLEKGTINATNLGSELQTAYGNAAAAARSLPAEFSQSYLDAFKAGVKGGVTTWTNQQISTAKASGQAHTDLLTLQSTLNANDFPEFMNDVYLTAVGNIGATVKSLEDAYGKEGTQHHIDAINGIVKQVQAGDITATQANALINAEYGLAESRAYALDDDGNPYGNQYITADQLTKINTAKVNALKELVPEWDKDPMLKSLIGTDLLASLYGDGTKLDSLDPAQRNLYYIAQNELMDSMFDLVIQWQMEGKEGKHTALTPEEFMQRKDEALNVFTEDWITLKTSSVNTNNGVKAAASNIGITIASGAAYIPEGTLSTEMGFYPFSSVMVSRSVAPEFDESIRRISADIGAKYKVAGGLGIDAQEPVGIMDGDTLVYQMADMSGDLLLYDTGSRKVSFMLADGSRMSVKEYDSLQGKKVSDAQNEWFKQQGYTGTLFTELKTMLADAGQDSEIRFLSDGSIVNSRGLAVDPQILSRAEENVISQAREEVSSAGSFLGALDTIQGYGSLLPGKDGDSLYMAALEVGKAEYGHEFDTSEYNALWAQNRTYGKTLKAITSQVEKASAEEAGEILLRYIDGLKDKDVIELMKKIAKKGGR